MCRHNEFVYEKLEDIYGDESIILGTIIESYGSQNKVGFFYSRYEDRLYIIGNETTSIEYAQKVKNNGLLTYIAEQLRVRKFRTYQMNYV